jgi:hypothetical protein
MKLPGIHRAVFNLYQNTNLRICLSVVDLCHFPVRGRLVTPMIFKPIARPCIPRIDR